MPGPITTPVQPGAQAQQPAPPADERVVNDQDKALAKDWLDRIEKALKRVPVDKFQKNRKLLAGKTGEDGATDDKSSVRANLHFANLAGMLPQIYAKDPEFSAKPTRAVGPEQMEATKLFAATAEFMLHKVVVKDGRLKHQAKKQIRSTFPTAVGWLKASYQETKKTDPLIANRIKDTQDNIERVQTLLTQAQDDSSRADSDLQLAKLREALAGLETQQEVTVAKGIALDFALSEDVVVIDPALRSVTDYTQAAAIAHRVWMTPEKYRSTFGYAAKKAKQFTEQAGKFGASESVDKASCLLCVWEIWSQEDNRLFYVCDGEEGFCKDPSSPEWTGKRWYPFFLLAFNEIDGAFYPLSDIELTEKLVKEYNEAREDFVRDRRECLPIRVIRKGGSLTPDDVKRVTNAKGGDTILVDGVGGQAITNDIWTGALGQIQAANYDTGGARYDIERILGGSDATTGSITKAKTATEAKILTHGLMGRTGERQDTMEDVLNEVGPYCLEIMLRKFSEQEVKAICGADATWPQMTIDQIFNLVTVEVRGGSTGKPDEDMEQERWSKLLPVVQEAVQRVADLREKGQEALAQAVIEITRETLRRFDERLDIEQFLPKQPADANDPAALQQQNVALKAQVGELMAGLKDVTAKVERGYVSAAASIATSRDPAQALMAFLAALGQIDPALVPETLQQQPGVDPGQPGAPQGDDGSMPPGQPMPPGPSLGGAPEGMPPPDTGQGDPLSQPQTA